MTSAESRSLRGAPLRNAAESELLHRIVASPGFARSPRLSAFLLYICERFFEQRLDEISEQQIGIQVFERPRDYHPTEDSIVRSHARLLRRKLELYFEREGAHEDLRLTIPKGSYIPAFEPRPLDVPTAPTAAAEASMPVAEPTLPALPVARPVFLNPPCSVTVLWAIAVLIAAGAGYWAGREAQAPKNHPLWSRIFSGAHPPLFVPADSGWVMYQNLNGKTLGLMDYPLHASVPGNVAGPIDSMEKASRDLGGRRYTSMVDLNFAARMLDAPWSPRSRLQIRYARDVKLDDLKGRNVILSGVAEANPWVELFERRLNFQFAIDETTRTFRVSNRHPAPGESEAYFNSPTDPQRRAYGLLAFQPGLDRRDDILLAEGTTMAGTEAAVDFALSDDALLPVLKRLMPVQGRLPYFEILVATTNMGGQAPRSELIAVRKDQ